MTSPSHGSHLHSRWPGAAERPALIVSPAGEPVEAFGPVGPTAEGPEAGRSTWGGARVARSRIPGADQPWTAAYLAFVLPLTPEAVLRSLRDGVSEASRQERRWISLAQRLTWLYGPDEALRRLNAGAA